MIYDVAVIGSGPGGYVAAIRAAELGLKTACIEKDSALGGTCLNVGCIPSKALLHSSELYAKLFSEYEQNGIQIKNPSFDFSKMMERKNGIISGFNQGIDFLFKKHRIDCIRGTAVLQSAQKISVGKVTVEAKNIILATGSEPIPLPFLPFDEKTIVSSTGALCLSEPPKKLLIIGAGIIGVELGSVYRRLGSEVVFLEFMDRVCPGLDGSLSKGLQKCLEAQGMAFHLNHKVIGAKGLEITAEGPQGKQVQKKDAVLVAIGRRPYTQNLGLEKLGIQKDPKGFLLVDSNFRTSVPNIYAIGDLIDGPMLAHKASEEGVAAAEIIAGERPIVDYLSIPNVAYTNPEVASVGFTEEELQKRSLPYKKGQAAFKINSRARCTGEEEGFVKVLAAEKSKKILGIHILGAHASELIAEACLAIRLRASANDLIHTCHAHPTLSESLKEAASQIA